MRFSFFRFHFIILPSIISSVSANFYLLGEKIYFLSVFLAYHLLLGSVYSPGRA